MLTPTSDFLIVTPDDVDLSRSPLAGKLGVETFVLGAFNPGLTRLPGGNLLLMVRVAEALRTPIFDDRIHAIRWDPEAGYTLDAYPLADVDVSDPRTFRIPSPAPVLGLTSLSWLLPIELDAEGTRIVRVHYERAIVPTASFQEYGIEDARISHIEGRYYLTTCSVSAERHSTVLYTSENGLDYTRQGIILDHQNKDMLLFEGKIRGEYWALTRPLGMLYFTYPPQSPYQPGPSINLARSPDALHWKPHDASGIRARRGARISERIGGGTPPLRTEAGWLVLYHGTEPNASVGTYRTFWALLDAEDPAKILRLEDEVPLLEAAPTLTEPLRARMYLHDIVFTTGIVDLGDAYLLASGEADLACRLTRVPKAVFR
jgi:predicted GH43/DUF377 family glycosyl hydrolase